MYAEKYYTTDIHNIPVSWNECER